MEWKVEDLKFFHELNEHSDYRGYNGATYRFSVEKEVSRDEKIAFLDKMQDGAMSQLLALVKKFEEERDLLPKNKQIIPSVEPAVKTVSLKAWLNRNLKSASHNLHVDTTGRGVCFLNATMRIEDLAKKNRKCWQYGVYEDLVDECFHRQLHICARMEEVYFNDHDTIRLKEVEVVNQWRKHGITFGYQLYDCTNSLKVKDGCELRKLTEAELDALIEKYQKLEAYIEELTNQ